MARRGTIAAQREGESDQVTVTVPAVDGMLHSVFVRHCHGRHQAELRFLTTNEHEAAHRLRDHPDHIHANHIEAPPQPETQTVKVAETRARKGSAR